MAWYLVAILLLQMIGLRQLGKTRKKLEHIDQGIVILYTLEMHQLSHICPESYQNLRVSMEAQAIMRESGMEH